MRSILPARRRENGGDGASVHGKVRHTGRGGHLLLRDEVAGEGGLARVGEGDDGVSG